MVLAKSAGEWKQKDSNVSPPLRRVSLRWRDLEARFSPRVYRFNVDYTRTGYWLNERP